MHENCGINIRELSRHNRQVVKHSIIDSIIGGSLYTGDKINRFIMLCGCTDISLYQVTTGCTAEINVNDFIGISSKLL